MAANAQEAGTPSVATLWDADKTAIFDANAIDIDDLIWIARPVVVFADSADDPRFRQQMELLAAQPDDLVDRDVIIVTDTDPTAQTALRLRLRPRGFAMVLIDKDGQIELRKPQPLDVREISRSIDKTPLRAQEVEDRRASR